MQKNIVQDVIPRETRRTIRDVPLASGREVPSHTKSKKYVGAQEVDAPREVKINRIDEDRSANFTDGDTAVSGFTRRWPIWILGILSAGVLVFVFGNAFANATVSVTPKSKLLTLDLKLTAKAKATGGQLGYTSLVLVRDESEVIQADGSRPVEARASGKILIYNNYSSGEQRLIKNTRFETPDGLIYKIADSVTVPGRSSVAGKILPGSIEVTVYAESAGEEYNIGLTDITIPGFKSSPDRFSAFYGRSKTAMTGGKIGTEKFVSDEKRSSTKKILQEKLEKSLLAEAKTQVPEDSILYDSAYQISFEPVVASNSETGNTVTIRERGRFTGFLIKRDALAKAVAEPLEISSPETLQFKTIKGNATAFNSTTANGPLEFSLKGSAQIVWKIDETRLKDDLAGKEKDELLPIAKMYSAISGAEVVLRPVWKNLFPASPSKIEIVILNPNTRP